MPSQLHDLRTRHAAYVAQRLTLNLERGQPSNEDFSLSNEIFEMLDRNDYITPSGVDIRNYPGGVTGIREARELFADYMNVEPAEMLVGNNSSLELMSNVLMWGMLRGMPNSPRPWSRETPKLIVTVPGYDRHFRLAQTIGFELVPVKMTSTGPDLDEASVIIESDPAVKGIFFVPTYSNPTGDTLSPENAERLLTLRSAAPDFTVFADDAYRHHHLDEHGRPGPNLLQIAKRLGVPDRVIVFGSTSKITFASAGIGFMAMSTSNLAHLENLIGAQTIGPNKAEQLRHVKFLSSYPGGYKGLLHEHAKILGPKFRLADDILERELGTTGLAEWRLPHGGYFMSFDTNLPVAKRVVALAKEAGVALTPAGATFPGGNDPGNRNIRIAPTRPSLQELEKAMEIFALSVRLASAELQEEG